MDFTMEDAAYLQMLCQDYWGCLNSARLQMPEPNIALEQTQTIIILLFLCFLFFFFLTLAGWKYFLTA